MMLKLINKFKRKRIEKEISENAYLLKLAERWKIVNAIQNYENEKAEIKLAQPIMNNNPKQAPDLQPLYYKKNDIYYETGLYVNPSEFKQSDLFPELPKETDWDRILNILSGEFIPANDTKSCSE